MSPHASWVAVLDWGSIKRISSSLHSTWSRFFPLLNADNERTHVVKTFNADVKRLTPPPPWTRGACCGRGLRRRPRRGQATRRRARPPVRHRAGSTNSGCVASRPLALSAPRAPAVPVDPPRRAARAALRRTRQWSARAPRARPRSSGSTWSMTTSRRARPRLHRPPLHLPPLRLPRRPRTTMYEVWLARGWTRLSVRYRNGKVPPCLPLRPPRRSLARMETAARSGCSRR